MRRFRCPVGGLAALLTLVLLKLGCPEPLCGQSGARLTPVVAPRVAAIERGWIAAAFPGGTFLAAPGPPPCPRGLQSVAEPLRSDAARLLDGSPGEEAVTGLRQLGASFPDAWLPPLAAGLLLAREQRPEAARQELEGFLAREGSRIAAIEQGARDSFPAPQPDPAPAPDAAPEPGPDPESATAALHLLFAAGTLDLQTGGPLPQARERIARALDLARWLALRGTIGTMESLPTREDLPVPALGCGEVAVGISVYDLYNNLLVSRLREAGDGPLPQDLLESADKLMAWALRPPPLLAHTLALLLDRAAAVPGPRVEELRRRRDELVAAALEAPGAAARADLAAGLVRLVLERLVETGGEVSLPAQVHRRLDDGQTRVVADLTFTFARKRMLAAWVAGPQAIENLEETRRVLRLRTEPWWSAAKLDVAAQPAPDPSKAIPRPSFFQLMEDFGMSYLWIAVLLVLALLAMAVVRWFFIQLRFRKTLMISFYQAEARARLRRLQERN